MRLPLALILATTVLAGCGQVPTARPATTKATKPLAAKGDAHLRAGVIKLRELRFKKLDINKNGAITPDEAADSALAVPGIIQGFGDYDANQDGQITVPEFLRDDVITFWMNELRPEIQKLFLKSDTNRDFKLTGAEKTKPQLYFNLFPECQGGDFDGDGAITYTEYEDAYMIALPKVQPPAPERDRPALHAY